jgi:hypothetical protein
MSSGKFKQLKLYLQALPEALQLVDTADQDAKINRLLTFSIDKEWAQDVGEEGAINREIEVTLQQFLPRNNARIFYITQQGKGIEELATVLEYWVTKFPESNILQSWLKSSIDSAEKCILKYGGKVSFPSSDWIDMRAYETTNSTASGRPSRGYTWTIKDSTA